mgnify:CR=1 FL=1
MCSLGNVLDLSFLIRCAVSTLLSLFPNSAASQMKLLQVRLCGSRLEEILFICCSRVGCHRIFHILSNIHVYLWWMCWLLFLLQASHSNTRARSPSKLNPLISLLTHEKNLMDRSTSFIPSTAFPFLLPDMETFRKQCSCDNAIKIYTA